jgi:hypothetical protein
LKEKVAAPVWKTEINGREGSAALTTRYLSNRKSWHSNSVTIAGSLSRYTSFAKKKAMEFVEANGR